MLTTTKTTCTFFFFKKSIRFSPPLVISEEDLQKSIGVIRQALVDLDKVRVSSLFMVCDCTQAYFSSFGRSRKFQAKWKARKVSGMRSATEYILIIYMNGF